MNACELTAAVTALANTLACRLSEEEIDLLGAVLTQLADTLFTIARKEAWESAAAGKDSCRRLAWFCSGFCIIGYVRGKIAAR